MVRVVEALGAAALLTSSFAIIANTFPNNVTAMFVGITRRVLNTQPQAAIANIWS